MTPQHRVGSAPTMCAELFENQRPRLTAIAYGMLGSHAEAEDVVQDAYIKWNGVDVGSIDSPAAYLTTITTRLAIDVLRSARARRVTYVGPWLPEPSLASFDPDPRDVVIRAESISLRLLGALERLNPVERAVLLLREVFDMDYTEIADVVDKSPTNCRQIAARARHRAGDTSSGPTATRDEERRILDAYIAALTTEDLERLTEVFAEDVVLWADGGGKVRAARHSIHGAARVARHLIGVSSQNPENMVVRRVRCNGDPALVGIVDETVIGVVAFEIAESRILGIRAQLNPDKLSPLQVPDILED